MVSQQGADPANRTRSKIIYFRTTEIAREFLIIDLIFLKFPFCNSLLLHAAK